MANPSQQNVKDLTNENYAVHTTVGHKNHDITFRRLPMYSFPKSGRTTDKNFSPGPAAYPSNYKEKGLTKSLYPESKAFSYSLGNRRCLDSKPINPGPAAYPIVDSRTNTYLNEKLPINSLIPPKKGNNFTFGGTRKPNKLSSLQTEPALYPSIGKSLGPQEQRNKFTFSGRPKTFALKFETPGPARYPIMHKEKINSIYPTETRLSPTMRAPYKDVYKSNSPAPDTYPRERTRKQDIIKTMISGPNAPAYSIRLRHDK